MLTRNTDIEAVSQELIEDNIVSVSRQMIDKESCVPSAQVGESNGHAANGNGADGMAIDEEEL